MSDDLRFALLVDPLTARLRGGQHAKELARALAQRGHTVRLFGRSFLSPADPGGADLPDEGDRRNTDRSVQGKKSLLGYAPRAVIAYDALSPTAYLGARIAGRLSVPLMLVEPGQRSIGSWLFNGMTRVGESLWGGQVRRRANTLVALDPVAREQALREGFEEARIRIVHHPVDCARFRPGMPSALVGRRRLQGRLILCISPLENRAGLELLVTAFAATVGQRGDWSLVLAGVGTNYARLRAVADRLGVGSRVYLIDPPSDDELPGLLSTATLGVLPQLDDKIRGAELARFFASGVPVLASDQPRTRGRIAETNCGLCAPAGNLAEWTDMLRRAAGSPTLRARWGQNARALALEQLAWPVVAEAFERAARDAIIDGPELLPDAAEVS